MPVVQPVDLGHLLQALLNQVVVAQGGQLGGRGALGVGGEEDAQALNYYYLDRWFLYICANPEYTRVRHVDAGVVHVLNAQVRDDVPP